MQFLYKEEKHDKDYADQSIKDDFVEVQDEDRFFRWAVEMYMTYFLWSKVVLNFLGIIWCLSKLEAQKSFMTS